MDEQPDSDAIEAAPRGETMEIHPPHRPILTAAAWTSAERTGALGHMGARLSEMYAEALKP